MSANAFADRMLSFIDASPSPYHACAETAARLDGEGFVRLQDEEPWELSPGSYYVARGGILMAFHLPQGVTQATGFRILGAHTDSPNLRIKPRPDLSVAGFKQASIEVYGGVLWNSWLDRDLGISGRVYLRGEHGPVERLFKIDRPVMRVPQLAIHLDRGVNTNGLQLNPERHLVPVFGLDDRTPKTFKGLLAAELDVTEHAILSFEAMAHDVQPSTRMGADGEFVSAPRLDNLCSTFCTTEALIERVSGADAMDHIAVLALFDHEEIGSLSTAGADGHALKDLLERITHSLGGSLADHQRAKADSICISADMAHGTHPNYTDKHSGQHWLRLGDGPVIKINANQRYATDSKTEAYFQMACENAKIPCQKWVMRADLACGSTIGPMTAATTGIPTVDVGISQLSMHSVREFCGTEDVLHYKNALKACL